MTILYFLILLGCIDVTTPIILDEAAREKFAEQIEQCGLLGIKTEKMKTYEDKPYYRGYLDTDIYIITEQKGVSLRKSLDPKKGFNPRKSTEIIFRTDNVDQNVLRWQPRTDGDRSFYACQFIFGFPIEGDTALSLTHFPTGPGKALDTLGWYPTKEGEKYPVYVVRIKAETPYMVPSASLKKAKTESDESIHESKREREENPGVNFKSEIAFPVPIPFTDIVARYEVVYVLGDKGKLNLIEDCTPTSCLVSLQTNQTVSKRMRKPENNLQP